MKKIFSFFTLLIFIIIALFNNTMMSFAMQDTSMKMEMQDMSWCWDNNEESKSFCNHECCYDSKWVSQVNLLNTTRENNKKLKIKVKSILDIFSFSIKSFENRKLIQITSPPNLLRDIKNYSYKDLTKIIKSNT